MNPPAVHCPHCKKTFQPDVVGANTRHAGYKCPHCKLYMPVARAVEQHSNAA
jgi:transposase-like protein